jgi:hypothetical protein
MRTTIFKTHNFTVQHADETGQFNIYITDGTSKLNTQAGPTFDEKSEPAMTQTFNKVDAVNIAGALQVAFNRGSDSGQSKLSHKIASCLGISEALRG